MASTAANKPRAADRALRLQAEHHHQVLSDLADISWPTDRQLLSKLTDNRCQLSSTKPWVP
jgi:hypothetical protein